MKRRDSLHVDVANFYLAWKFILCFSKPNTSRRRLGRRIHKLKWRDQRCWPIKMTTASECNSFVCVSVVDLRWCSCSWCKSKGLMMSAQMATDSYLVFVYFLHPLLMEAASEFVVSLYEKRERKNMLWVNSIHTQKTTRAKECCRPANFARCLSDIEASKLNKATHTHKPDGWHLMSACLLMLSLVDNTHTQTDRHQCLLCTLCACEA